MESLSDKLKCLAHSILSVDRESLRKKIDDEVKRLKKQVNDLERNIKERYPMTRTPDRNINEESEEAIENWNKQVEQKNDRIKKLESLRSKTYMSPEEYSKVFRSDPLIGPWMEQQDKLRKKEEEHFERLRK